jgi:hypothetical protein
MALPFFLDRINPPSLKLPPALKLRRENRRGRQPAWIIFKFDHALFLSRRIKDNRQMGIIIILFDPEHFNDVYKPIEGIDQPL